MNKQSRIGCGGCFLIFVLISCCFGVVGGATIYTINNSDIYQLAVDAVQESPRAIDVLGTPIEPSWFAQIEVNSSNGQGSGWVKLPVSGPKASGIVTLSGTYQNGGDWQIDLAELEVDGERFSLAQ